MIKHHSSHAAPSAPTIYLACPLAEVAILVTRRPLTRDMQAWARTALGLDDLVFTTSRLVPARDHRCVRENSHDQAHAISLAQMRNL